MSYLPVRAPTEGRKKRLLTLKPPVYAFIKCTRRGRDENAKFFGFSHFH